MKITLAPLRVQLAFYAFALGFSTAAIACFSMLSGIPLPAGLYVIGGVMSVVIFWLFLATMLSVMSWTDERT